MNVNGLKCPTNINQSPSSAHTIDQNGNNVTSLLLNPDSKYFTQPNIGDEVIVKFSAEKSDPELAQTMFLKNRGYYNYIRDYKGDPNLESLKVFRKPGSFTDFSKLEYHNIMDVKNSEYIALKE